MRLKVICQSSGVCGVIPGETAGLIGAWEAPHHLVRVSEAGGMAAAGAVLAAALSNPRAAVQADFVEGFAHPLLSGAEKKSWTKNAPSFTQNVVSWPDVLTASRSEGPLSEQSSFAHENDNV